METMRIRRVSSAERVSGIRTPWWRRRARPPQLRARRLAHGRRPWCRARSPSGAAPRALTSMNRHVRDDHVHALAPGQGSEQCSRGSWACRPWPCAPSSPPRACAPETRSMAPPMPFDHLAGIIQFARLPSRSTCSAPEDREVDVAAAHHRERVGAREIRRCPAARSPSPCPALMRSGSFLARLRIGPDAEHAVLGVQHDRDALGHVVGGQGRACRCRGSRSTPSFISRAARRTMRSRLGRSPLAPAPRTVRFSMRFS